MVALYRQIGYILSRSSRKDRIIRLNICIILFFLSPCPLSAQFFYGLSYKGADVSFGTRSFQLKSDIPELHELRVLEEGGQVGIMAGSNAFRAKVGIAGFFYSANRVGRTIDVFESDAVFNFYPFEFYNSSRLVQPYVTGGLVYGKTKFYGYYAHHERQPVNYSSSEEPLCGSIFQLRGALGGGVELKVHNNDFNFAHIFSEVKYGIPFLQSASNDLLKNTSFSDQCVINVGVRFGGRDEL